jgi:serine/threonine protein phosphatase PrpC
VADGMGGAQAGEVAAQITIDHLRGVDRDGDGADVVAAIEQANRAIVAAAADDPDKSGMGTTVTALRLQDGALQIAHVGDSRAYLWRDGRLRQLTSDHSVVAELVRRGRISAEEAESHPHRNVITRALGADARVEVDSVDRAGRDGDVVLLCSDGLSGQVDDEAIAAVMRTEPDLTAAAAVLVEQANAAGGVDNVTVILARLGAGAQATSEIPISRTDEAPARRRGLRLSPPALAAAVLLALAIGATAWVWSRSFTVQANDGEVVVKRGIAPQIGSFPPQVTWQATGLDAAAVDEVEPASLTGSTRGRGEAVLLATRLVWQYGIPEAPAIALPVRPTPRPAPPNGAPEAP